MKDTIQLTWRSWPSSTKLFWAAMALLTAILLIGLLVRTNLPTKSNQPLSTSHTQSVDHRDDGLPATVTRGSGTTAVTEPVPSEPGVYLYTATGWQSIEDSARCWDPELLIFIEDETSKELTFWDINYHIGHFSSTTFHGPQLIMAVRWGNTTGGTRLVNSTIVPVVGKRNSNHEPVVHFHPTWQGVATPNQKGSDKVTYLALDAPTCPSNNYFLNIVDQDVLLGSGDSKLFFCTMR